MKMRSSRAVLAFAAAALACFAAFRLFFWNAPFPSPSSEETQADPSLVAPGDLGSRPTSTAFDSLEFRRTRWTPVPALTARGVLIADPTTGETLFRISSGARWPIASLTKLMTAQIVAGAMDQERSITLARPDFADGGNSLTAAMIPGDRYRAADLLRVMLISSSNEAAEAFARTYGRDAFIAAMNARAAEWGLADTHFADPSGISAGNQSTPGDFLGLVRRIWSAHPELFEATRLPSLTVVESRTGESRTFLNTNEFAGRPDFLGGKTGTTPEAGENLLTLFSFGSRPVMILLFGSSDRFRETEALLQWFTHDFSSSDTG